jgi:hypothetical protein
MIELLDRLARGAQSLANHATLVKAQVADLEAANQALAARKSDQNAGSRNKVL